MKKNVLLNDSSFFFFQIPTQSFSVLLPGVCLRNISRFFAKKIIFFSIVSLLPFSLLFRSVLVRFDIWTRVTEIGRWRTGSHIWKKVNVKMHNIKEKFEIDYSSFRTEVSKRRRSATTRELSKEIFFFFSQRFYLSSINDWRKTKKKKKERDKRTGRWSPLTKEMLFRACFSENSVFRAEERGLVGWGYAERRNLPIHGDLHQT